MGENVDHPDVLALRRYAAGGRAAGVELVQRLAPVIRARVRLFLRHRPQRSIGGRDEDDLIQHIWCQLIEDQARRLARYDPAHGVSLEGYVSVIAQRMLIDLTRGLGDRVAHVQLQALDGAADDGHNPEVRVIGAQTLAALQRHLDATLPERGRLVARLVYVDHRSDDEAAALLNVSKQVIANWKHRIRQAALAFRSGGAAEEKRDGGRARRPEQDAPDGEGGR